jgi:hypothetical protein
LWVGSYPVGGAQKAQIGEAIIWQIKSFTFIEIPAELKQE